MPAIMHGQETGIIPALRTAVIAGGSAGNHSVAAIKAGDMIALVWEAAVTTDLFTDRTAEFKKASGDVTADGIINNTSGTDTTNDQLLVGWFKHSTE